MTVGLKIGYHAPPPGSHSGVADYAETLRIALQRFGRVESDASKADIHLYHLGNNRLHEDIYARALATPGVVVLHDAVLHHFLLGSLSREQYISEWLYNYGEWRRDLGEELWRERARASVDPRYFEFPMLRRILEQSLRVIVHNPGAAGIVRAHGAKQVEIIPHFCEVSEPPGAAEVAQFRERNVRLSARTEAGSPVHPGVPKAARGEAGNRAAACGRSGFAGSRAAFAKRSQSAGDLPPRPPE